MGQREYTEKLEKIIKQMLIPLKGVPLNLVIESISGFKILPFNKKDNKDKKLLEKLKQISEIAGKTINKKGIKRRRANEVGNDIEYFVKKALNRAGYTADIPKSKIGKRKTMGYPDIEFVDEFKRFNYLECKTFNFENIDSAQRSFYLSPSEDFKINHNARHFVLTFEIFVAKKYKQDNIYKCKSWKILDIEKMEVDVKYEFNTNNLRMYKDKFILAQGIL